MMKLAVLSDIHGNLPALNAVLKDINNIGVNKYIIAGDHIVDCPQPNEVLDKIKSLNAYIIKGNREQYVTEYHQGMHNEWNNHKQMSAVLWTYNTLNEQNIKYINELPEQLNISFTGIDAIRVVHGSPLKINDKLFPFTHTERLEKAVKAVKEPVLICGHTHESWSRIAYNKLIVNPGSVGVPFNNNRFAEYAVLVWENNKWTVSHCQVKYDLGELENTFIESGIMEESRAWSRITIDSIKQGKDITLEFIRYAYKLAESMGFNNLKLLPDYIWDRAEQLWFEK